MYVLKNYATSLHLITSFKGTQIRQKDTHCVQKYPEYIIEKSFIKRYHVNSFSVSEYLCNRVIKCILNDAIWVGWVNGFLWRSFFRDRLCQRMPLGTCHLGHTVLTAAIFFSLLSSVLQFLGME